MSIRFLTALAAVLLVSCRAGPSLPAGHELKPFGFSTDQGVPEGFAPVPGHEGYFAGTEAPRGEEAIDRYYLRTSADGTLCELWAFTRGFPSGADGARVREVFLAFRGGLVGQHGEPSIDVNLLLQPSYFEGRYRFMTALLLGERVVVTSWLAAAGWPGYDDVMNIELRAGVASGGEAALRLLYELSACRTAPLPPSALSYDFDFPE